MFVLLGAPIGCRDAEGERERLVGFGSDRCIDVVDGLSHGSSFRDLTVTLTRYSGRVMFEGLPSFACPVDATDDGETLDVANQDCARGLREEIDIQGEGTRDGDLLELELESTELRTKLDDPSGPTHDVPCTHHYALRPADG